MSGYSLDERHSIDNSLYKSAMANMWNSLSLTGLIANFIYHVVEIIEVALQIIIEAQNDNK